MKSMKSSFIVGAMTVAAVLAGRQVGTASQDPSGSGKPRSEIEKNTTSRAGAPAAGIRSAVGDPATNTVAKGEVTRDILAAPQGDNREAQASAGS